MAGVKGTFTSGQVSLSAATAKTAHTVVAASNHRALITRIGIAFEGIVTTDTPVKVRVAKATTAGTGTASTPVKRGDFGETLQSSGLKNLSAEPTLTDVYDDFAVHPQGGVIWNHYYADPLPVAGGARVGIELTAPQAQTCRVVIDFEE